MKIKEIVSIISRSTTINCFEEYQNSYDEYSNKTAEKLNDKEVVQMACFNTDEISIYYKGK